MSNGSSGASASVDLITDLAGKYGKQIIQLFTAFAGAAGLFYTIGFIIVNVSLLKLGVYEAALISVGYVAPGVAFAVIFSLSALSAIGVFASARRLLRLMPMPAPLRTALIILIGSAIVGGGAIVVGWAMWFFVNIAAGVTLWCAAVGLTASLLAYAEHFPLVKRILMQRIDEEGKSLSPMQARIQSPAFVLVAAALTFAAILVYGQSVYDQIPPVFGGGLPIVVRFFGDKVGDLAQVGIDLEPGETNLSERVELIAQTEDRYIVRAGNRAISFDKRFVQGIRYEPPEFFLESQFLLSTHTKQGERFLADERYDEALSEFDLVLNQSPEYVPALHGRAEVQFRRERYEQALQDYQTLTRVESINAQNFYDLATTTVYFGVAADHTIQVDDVTAALTQAAAISATLGEQARADETFNPLRGNQAFDLAVYGSGPDAARWFRARGEKFIEENDLDVAIDAYEWAIRYDNQYVSDADALSPREAADLHLNLSQLYLARDPLSEEAILELEAAALLFDLSPNDLADVYVALSELYLQRDPLSDKAVEALVLAVNVTGQQDAHYLIRLAQLYSARGDSARAQDIYALVLQLDTADTPNRREALIGQGRAALESGDYDKASAAFEQALSIVSNDAATLYDYARALAALNDARVEGFLRQAIDLDSSLAETAQAEALFSNAGTAVANLITGALKAREARSLRDQGDIPGAITALQEATQVEPSVASYWIALADVLAQEGRNGEAIAAYQNALPLAGAIDQISLLAALAEVQLAADDYAGAIASFTQAINAQAGSAPAGLYARLARAHELNKQFDLAAATYDVAALRDPANAEYTYRSGLDLLLAGQVDAGLERLQSALDQGGLRVESADLADLYAEPSTGAQVLATLTVGSVLSIQSNPLVSEEKVWWPVRDQDGTLGYVPADGVVPAPPGVPSVAPVSQQPPLSTTP